MSRPDLVFAPHEKLRLPLMVSRDLQEAHTCSSNLELSTDFVNFENDFRAKTNEEFTWRMDAV